jgi:hypothetical protein
MAEADPIRCTRRGNTDIAAQAASVEGGHWFGPAMDVFREHRMGGGIRETV